ncbi:hypothetical protein ACFQZE_01105 [Paenibacillus sp. GCM10027627]|uniref:hypothetical protein n=1 Tax=unclassified Paenibacillus TaxID=185978 RepID=UPI00362BDCCE
MNFVAWLIIACEIAFWIFIALGLTVRYVLKKEKLGLLFLLMSPVVDVVLLVATGIDMYNGATATMAHAIAAVYIGVSVAFGKSMIAWADERFSYYIAKEGPAPVKRYGKEYAIHDLKGWGRHVIAYLIGAGLMLILVFWIDDPSRTEAFTRVWQTWSLILGIDLIISISSFIWPKRPRSK